jgi:glycosyltransferase involved in cell wall biosynthesis
MKKVAIVVQRYGKEICGGAEFHAMLVAEHLAKKYNIEVLTTTSTNYLKWENTYREGRDEINGVSVIRFRTEHKRKTRKLNMLSEKIIPIIKNRKKTTDHDANQWIDLQGPYCPSLLDYIRNHKDDYDAFIFFTYLYYPTVRGLPLVGKKAAFIPTAHDEVWIRLSIYDKIFQEPGYFIFNTEEERQFVRGLFHNADIPSDIGGVGIDIPEATDAEGFRKKFGITGNYIIYVGRIDVSKGCDFLIRAFMKFKDDHPSDLKLVLVGISEMAIPNNPDIIQTGFVTEQEKYDGMAGALAMVTPSKLESLCMAFLESLAVGAPIIANGECEVLKAQCHRSNAGLYYTGYREFEGCLDYMLSHNRERIAMGKKGKRFVEDNYSWEEITEKMSKAIEYISDH